MEGKYSPFSVALIDLFASSAIAFMILMIIAMPYLFNEDTANVGSLAQMQFDAANEVEMIQILELSAARIEKLEADLNEAMQGTSKIQSETPLSAKIDQLYNQPFTMNLPLIFDGNQWYIRPENRSILDMMGRELSINLVEVEIVGHTATDVSQTNREECFHLDNFGDINTQSRVESIAPIGAAFKQCFIGGEWNYHLSEQRAKAVKNYLIKSFDIDPNRIRASGVGSDEHLPDMDSDDSRNRRVEIKYSVR
jgi:outer membrane protein OmpA-like peptidoglycan-associated protein